MLIKEIYVYVINRGKMFKSEIFEWNTLIKQIYVVWKKRNVLLSDSI